MPRLSLTRYQRQQIDTLKALPMPLPPMGADDDIEGLLDGLEHVAMAYECKWRDVLERDVRFYRELGWFKIADYAQAALDALKIPGPTPRGLTRIT